MRYKNVEFRQAVVQTWQDESGNGNHASSERPAEIVGWMNNNGKESCYTLCWLKEGKEEFYIETTGSSGMASAGAFLLYKITEL